MLSLLSFSQKHLSMVNKDEYKELNLKNKLKVYISKCNNKETNKVVSDVIIKYDKFKKIGYLKSYNTDSFHCYPLDDTFYIASLNKLLQQKERLNNKICILFNMAGKSGELIHYATIFTEKRFNKFLEKQVRTQRKKNKQTGEIDELKIIDFTAYANEYIIAKINNLYQVFKICQ